jgi:hypothetical protein
MVKRLKIGKSAGYSLMVNDFQRGILNDWKGVGWRSCQLL